MYRQRFQRLTRKDERILTKVTPKGDFAIYFKEQTGLDHFFVIGSHIIAKPVAVASGVTRQYEIRCCEIRDSVVFHWIVKQVSDQFMKFDPVGFIHYHDMHFYLTEEQADVVIDSIIPGEDH